MSERLETKRCIKALYKYSSFPFLFDIDKAQTHAAESCFTQKTGVHFWSGFHAIDMTPMFSGTEFWIVRNANNNIKV